MIVRNAFEQGEYRPYNKYPAEARPKRLSDVFPINKAAKKAAIATTHQGKK